MIFADDRFTFVILIDRGRGPLKSTMDVISAAKKISEHGTNLDKIAATIADQVCNMGSRHSLLILLRK